MWAQKIPPDFFLTLFSKTVGNFSPNFTAGFSWWGLGPSHKRRRVTGARDCTPLPLKKSRKNIFRETWCKIREFSGKCCVKCGNFVNFSNKCHVNFEHFVNYSYIISGKNVLPSSTPPKLTELLRLWAQFTSSHQVGNCERFRIKNTRLASKNMHYCVLVV